MPHNVSPSVSPRLLLPALCYFSVTTQLTPRKRRRCSVRGPLLPVFSVFKRQNSSYQKLMEEKKLHHHLISSHLIIYNKKLKQLKSFLTKIRPTVPLTEAPPVRPKGLTKGRGRLVFSIFFTKILIIFTPVIFYTHLLYSRITFL